MEQPPQVETMYGKSLRLNIPRLTCDQTNCAEQNIFLGSRSASATDVITRTNNYVLSMVNCFVDFFIQYQTVDNEPIDTTDASIQILLELKKIIFSFCLLRADLPDLPNYFQQFFALFQDKYGACIMTIKNKFEIVQDVGVPDLTMRETFENKPTSFAWLKQKSMNLFLFGLSYKVLSFSGSLGIQIKDISDVIRAEKRRESGGQQSFILQFLPYNKEVKCFEKVDFFFLEKMNSVIFQKISSLALAGESGGGSKRFKKIKYTTAKSQKNTKKGRNRNSKHYRHSRHSRHKRTQKNAK